MSFTVIKQTIDYVGNISAQIDRVSEAASNIDDTTIHRFRASLKRFYYALQQLCSLVRGVSSEAEKFENEMKKILTLLSSNKSSDLYEAFLTLHEIQVGLIRILDKHRLLIRRSVIEAEYG